jgi:hypothetical protein
MLMWRRLAVSLLLACSGAAALAEEPGVLLDKFRALESATVSLLAEQYRFEESLLSPDSDRIVVFLTIPHGKRVIIDQVNLKIDGKSTGVYTYSASELNRLRERASQLLYAGRLPPGAHTLRLEVKTQQGVVVPMKDYSFTKEDNAKFVEIQIAGYEIREIFVVDW